MEIDELIQAAHDVRERAYAPYSNFQVGAAVVATSGEVFLGCNVENASYGLSICAERNAICQAVAKGLREFQTIVVIAAPLATPCGACRQFIHEFGTEIEVVCVDASDLSRRKTWRIAQLLPEGFEL